MIILISIAALFVILAIIIITGKGDWLIAGYNTASKEEKTKYDIVRLRFLVALTLVISAIACVLLSVINETISTDTILGGVFTIVIFVIIIVILANSWAKKK